MGPEPSELRCDRYGLHDLQFDLDLHVVSDENAAGFERLIPLESPGSAVDLRRGARAGTSAAPRVLACAFEFTVECDFHGGAADRQVADDAKLVAFLLRGAFDALAAERERRLALDVEEIGRAEM